MKKVFLVIISFLLILCLTEPKKEQTENSVEVENAEVNQKESEKLFEKEINLDLLIKLYKCDKDVFNKWCFENDFSKVEETPTEITFNNIENTTISKAHFITLTAQNKEIIENIYNECKLSNFNFIEKVEEEPFYVGETLIFEAKVREVFEKDNIRISFSGTKDKPFSVIIIK